MAPQEYKDYCLALAKQDKARYEAEMKEYCQTQDYLRDLEKQQTRHKHRRAVDQVHKEEDDCAPIPLNEVATCFPHDDHRMPSMSSMVVADCCRPAEMQPVHIARLAQQLDRESQEILIRALLT